MDAKFEVGTSTAQNEDSGLSDQVTPGPPTNEPGTGSKRPAGNSMERRGIGAKRARRVGNVSPIRPDFVDVKMDPDYIELANDEADSLEKEGWQYAEEQAGESTVWRESITAYRQQTLRPLAPAPGAKRRAELIAKCRIGGAYINAFGLGHLNGVVNLSEEPDLRGNPRVTEESHIKNLYDVFRVPGGKMDHESPIVLMISPRHIDPECLALMRQSEPRDPAAVMPALRLVGSPTDEETNLEERLLFSLGREGYASEEEIKCMKTRLASLYAARPRATLLNGSHRIQAILRVGCEIAEEQAKLVDQVRVGVLRGEDLKANIQVLVRQRAPMATYRVDVYDADCMSNELLNWLVRNEDQRPAKGMGPGEKAWWTAHRLDVLMTEARQNGAKTRAEEADIAHAAWKQELGANMMQMQQIEDTDGNHGRSDGHRRGDWAGQDVASRLFTEPLTMGMVMETRNALEVYNNILQMSHSVSMLQPNGALLTCRFWLSTQTLLKIFNVANGMGLEEAQNFLEDSHPLTVAGDPTALRHWINLHARPQKIPPYLKYYTRKVAGEFDEQYLQAVNKLKQETGEMKWSEDSVILGVREVFDAFGRWIYDPNIEWKRWVAASLRIYARLPLLNDDTAGDTFYSTAALPAPHWMEDVRKTQMDVPKESFVIFEYLLDRYLPVWTIGAQSNSRSENVHNWYGRQRAPHQLAMRILGVPSLGLVERRLDKAIIMLEDPLLWRALRDVNRVFGNRMKDLVQDCCVRKGEKINYPILDVLLDANVVKNHGGMTKLHASLGNARRDLKYLISQPQPPTPNEITQLYRDHPVLNILPDDFWTSFDPFYWVNGWNTASKSKRSRDVSCLVGWGFLIQALDREVERIMRRKEASHLLRVCRDLASLTKTRVWWCDRPFAQVPWRNSPYSLAPPPDLRGHTHPDSPLEPQPKRDSPEVAVQPHESDHLGKAVSRQMRPVRESKLSGSQAVPHAPLSDTTRLSQSMLQETISEQQMSGSSLETKSTTTGSSQPLSQTRRNVITTDVVQGLNPSHVLTTVKVDFQTSDHIHRHYMRMTDGGAKESMGAFGDRFQGILDRINEERQKLRESFQAVAQHCVNAPYGGYFAKSGMSAVNAHYKDIFVLNIANILGEGLGLSDVEAVNEAVAMARSDGLYREEVCQLNDGQSQLAINLRGTMAQGAQSQVTNESDFLLEIGAVPGTADERDRIWRLMSFMHPARGVGRTENESYKRGLEGLLLQMCKEKTASQPVPEFSGISHCSPDLPPPDTFNPFQAIARTNMEELKRRWNWETHSAASDALTSRPKDSILSTGRFEPGGSTEGAGPSRVTSLPERAYEAWDDAQSTDLRTFRNFIGHTSEGDSMPLEQGGYHSDSESSYYSLRLTPTSSDSEPEI